MIQSIAIGLRIGAVLATLISFIGAALMSNLLDLSIVQPYNLIALMDWSNRDDVILAIVLYNPIIWWSLVLYLRFRGPNP